MRRFYVAGVDFDFAFLKIGNVIYARKNIGVVDDIISVSMQKDSSAAPNYSHNSAIPINFMEGTSIVTGGININTRIPDPDPEVDRAYKAFMDFVNFKTGLVDTNADNTFDENDKLHMGFVCRHPYNPDKFIINDYLSHIIPISQKKTYGQESGNAQITINYIARSDNLKDQV